MGVSLLAALALGIAQKGGGPEGRAPVLWLTPEGRVLVRGRSAPARLTPGAAAVQTPFGLGLDFDGTKGGLLMPDLPALALSDAMTVSAWVYLRAYVKAGPGAQILFRGDDRSGLDAYTLALHPNGDLFFGFHDVANGADSVGAHLPLKRWVHVTASYDTIRSQMKLWFDDLCVATAQTGHIPLKNLRKEDAPGVSVGNVQNDKGPHNQPLDGIVADLRLYDVALKPAEAGWRPFKG